MKKIFYILSLFVICVTLQSSAQILFGPQVGANLATLDGTNVTVTPKRAWHGGIFVSVPLWHHFSIMPAVVYSMMGYHYKDTTNTTPNTDSTVTVTEKVNATLRYLDVPILLTYFTGENRGLMIQAGPQFSYLITDNSTVTTTATVSKDGSVAKPATPADINAISFNKSDFALVGGIGYKFPELLIVYARVATSFVETQSGGWAKSPDTGKNFVFEFGAALSFGAK